MAVDPTGKAVYVTELNPPRIWKYVNGAGKLIICLSPTFAVYSGLCACRGLFEVVHHLFLCTCIDMYDTLMHVHAKICVAFETMFDLGEYVQSKYLKWICCVLPIHSKQWEQCGW